MNFPKAAGSFLLTLDGAPISAYVRAVDGGFVKAAVVDEPIGPENLRIKHTSVAEIDPFAFEIGLAGSKKVLELIAASWKKNFQRFNGQVSHGDMNRTGFGTQEFRDALITETTFPALDAKSTEAPYLKVKMLPEFVTYAPDDSHLHGQTEITQKEWSVNNFRLTIDGVATANVQKIESFSVKQSVKKYYVGRDRFPQIEPTKVEFPNIVATLAEAGAKPVLDWYRSFLHKGQPDPRAERAGAIEFLSPDLKRVMLRINLKQVGLASAQLIGSQANQKAIKLCKFELYVGAMDIDFGASVGLT